MCQQYLNVVDGQYGRILHTGVWFNKIHVFNKICLMLCFMCLSTASCTCQIKAAEYKVQYSFLKLSKE